MPLEKNIQEYILGETDESLVCIGAEENQVVATAMIQQTHRDLDIFSHHFDPEVYDTPSCYAAFEELALRSRHSRIRILIQEPYEVAHHGHRILELGKRLNTYFHFRKPANKYRLASETFLVADNIGVIHRPYPDSIKAIANFNDGVHARKLSKLFTEMWEEAELDPNLRIFTI